MSNSPAPSLTTTPMISIDPARRPGGLAGGVRVSGSKNAALPILAASLLDYYRTTLRDVGEVGYATYAVRQLRPYVRAAASHMSPERGTLTERFLDRK